MEGLPSAAELEFLERPGRPWGSLSPQTRGLRASVGRKGQSRCTGVGWGQGPVGSTARMPWGLHYVRPGQALTHRGDSQPHGVRGPGRVLSHAPREASAVSIAWRSASPTAMTLSFWLAHLPPLCPLQFSHENHIAKLMLSLLKWNSREHVAWVWGAGRGLCAAWGLWS